MYSKPEGSARGGPSFFGKISSTPYAKPEKYVKIESTVKIQKNDRFGKGRSRDDKTCIPAGVAENQRRGPGRGQADRVGLPGHRPGLRRGERVLGPGRPDRSGGGRRQLLAGSQGRRGTHGAHPGGPHGYAGHGYELSGRGGRLRAKGYSCPGPDSH